MLTLKDLSQRYSLTPKQVRRYWDSVAPLLAQYAQRGPHNVILLSEQGIPIFDRLLELVRSGLSLSAAADKLREELNDSRQAEAKLSGNDGTRDMRDELIAILKTQLTEKDRQIAVLLSQLQDAQAKLHAMLPGPRPSLWQRLAAVFKH